MTVIDGLVGYRPHPDHAAEVTAPPYDVIKPGSKLEKLVFSRDNSLVHVTLGKTPAEALQKLVGSGALQPADEPSFYVYEQTWDGGRRVGFFAATQVTPYEKAQVIRHEKVFDEKVKGRIALANAVNHTIEPIFLLTASSITPVMEAVMSSSAPLYHFTTDLGNLNDLHGITSRVFHVPQTSPHFTELRYLVGQNALYIADGHHRYHAALKNNQTHVLSYIVENAGIQAYNRVIRGKIPFETARQSMSLAETDTLQTPPKNHFCVYHAGKAYLLKAKEVPEDVVGQLDCSILEREVYPLLGLDHSDIKDENHFDYYAESRMDEMKEAVDEGKYDIAVALHPVAIAELMAVADAGLKDSNIVMPEKSTFFAPKILSGLFLYRHTRTE